jgi:hypothetical protein
MDASTSTELKALKARLRELIHNDPDTVLCPTQVIEAYAFTDAEWQLFWDCGLGKDDGPDETQDFRAEVEVCCDCIRECGKQVA